MYTLLTAEPPTNTTGLWVFGSIFFIAVFCFVMSIVYGGKKEEEARMKSNDREPRPWDNNLYVAHIAGEEVVLDEHESAISDTPELLDVQSN